VHATPAEKFLVRSDRVVVLKIYALVVDSEIHAISKKIVVYFGLEDHAKYN
jgi:hypothetical protein